VSDIKQPVACQGTGLGTSVIYLYNTPGYQSKMGIYVGTMASVPSSVQPLAAGCFRSCQCSQCLYAGLSIISLQNNSCIECLCTSVMRYN
jgi:hypothetical protein